MSAKDRAQTHPKARAESAAQKPVRARHGPLFAMIDIIAFLAAFCVASVIAGNVLTSVSHRTEGFGADSLRILARELMPQARAQAQAQETVQNAAGGAAPPEGSLSLSPATDGGNARAQGGYAVQAVLSPKRKAVISSVMDGRITRMKLSNGDTFRRGEILVEYDCDLDVARMREAESRQRATQGQLEAYEKLRTQESVSEVELLMARENNEQNKAMVDQVRARLKLCRIYAPFDGRVANKMASQYEFAQAGRVLMDITSREPLKAEFLVPSKWLRWLNVGTPLQIHIGETERGYAAKITAVYGEVDPVSQSVQVAAELEKYHEELLPGMSGQALFDGGIVVQGAKSGFLGLMLKSNWTDGDGGQKAK